MSYLIKKSVFLMMIFVSFLACKQDAVTEPEDIVFDQEKWREKQGSDYTFRARMLRDVVYNDTIRSLSKSEILDLLGAPDKEKDDHLYYRIDQQRLNLWPIHTTTMVIKFANPDSIEWIKIHE